MHYSEHPYMVQADRFRIYGRHDGYKWYDTWAINMEKYYDEISPHEAVAKAWRDKNPDGAYLSGMILVVMEPYHKYSYPVILNATSMIELS